MLDGIKIINNISKVPKKSTVNRINKINSQLAQGDWKIQTVVELMGQSAVMETEQIVLNKKIDKLNLLEIYHGYMVVYKSALPGLGNSKKYINRIIDLMESLKSCGYFNGELLMEKNLNKWFVNGQRNLSNE